MNNQVVQAEAGLSVPQLQQLNSMLNKEASDAAHTTTESAANPQLAQALIDEEAQLKDVEATKGPTAAAASQQEATSSTTTSSGQARARGPWGGQPGAKRV